MPINDLIGDRELEMSQFSQMLPSYLPKENRLFRQIDYFNLGVGVLFYGVRQRSKMEKLKQVARNKSIESPYERLFMVFERDNRQYSKGQEIVLSEPVYASPVIETVRNSLLSNGSTFLVIDGKVNGLPLPLSSTNYEPAFLINEGTRFKVVSIEVVDWTNPLPRISCSSAHKQVNIVHLEVENHKS